MEATAGGAVGIVVAGGLGDGNPSSLCRHLTSMASATVSNVVNKTRFELQS